MKKASYIVFSLLLSSSVIAGEYGKYSTKEEAIEGHKRNLEKVGGYVERPVEGPAVLFINEQNNLPDSDFRAQVQGITSKLRIRNIIQTGSTLSAPSFLATNYLSNADIAAVISVCEIADTPALTIYPELRAAVINVSPLSADKKELLAERVRKELWRAFGFVFGGGYTIAYPKAALRPIGSDVKELDRLECVSLSIDSLQSINKVMERWGMTPVKKTSYKRACEEGWAPAPTNEIQKAIWEQAKKNAETNAPAVKR